jgi:hypothetical protein
VAHCERDGVCIVSDHECHGVSDGRGPSHESPGECQWRPRYELTLMCNVNVSFIRWDTLYGWWDEGDGSSKLLISSLEDTHRFQSQLRGSCSCHTTATQMSQSN